MMKWLLYQMNGYMMKLSWDEIVEEGVKEGMVPVLYVYYRQGKLYVILFNYNRKGMIYIFTGGVEEKKIKIGGLTNGRKCS